MLDQQHFVKEVTATKAQNKVVPLKVNPTLMSEFRPGIGSSEWLAAEEHG